MIPPREAYRDEAAETVLARQRLAEYRRLQTPGVNLPLTVGVVRGRPAAT